MKSEDLEKYGFTYWKIFIEGRRGTPYPVVPSLEMWTDFQVFGLTKWDKITGDKMHHEVLFDKHYCLHWQKGHKDLLLAISQFKHFEGLPSLFDEDELSETQLSTLEAMELFEKSAKIKPNGKNPRHDLYLKFKEYAQCQQQ